MSKSLRVSFSAWIDFGGLSGVYPGQTKSSVLAVLGAPFGWVNAKSESDPKDFMAAEIWGYAIWTFYFNEDVLDAITCATSKMEEHGWYFEMESIDPSFFNGVDDATRVLDNLKINYKILERNYSLKNSETGEIVEKRRRLSARTILVGDELQTRILFADENGKMEVIGNPFSLRRQVISHAKLDPKGRFLLIDRPSSN